MRIMVLVEKESELMPDFSLGISIQSLSSVKINDIPPVRTVGGYQQEVDRLVNNKDSD